jgi:hypothetical protein
VPSFRACSHGSHERPQAIFTAAGDAIVTLLQNDTLMQWDAVTFQLRAELTPPPFASPTAFSTLAVSADGRLLLAAGQYERSCLFVRGHTLSVCVMRSAPVVCLWDLSADLMLRAVQPPQGTSSVKQAAFIDAQVCSCSSVQCQHKLDGGKTVALLCDDGGIRLIEIPTVKVAACIRQEGVVRGSPLRGTALAHVLLRQAFDKFAVHPAGRYLCARLSTGSMLLVDVDVARSSQACACRLPGAVLQDLTFAFGSGGRQQHASGERRA